MTVDDRYPEAWRPSWAPEFPEPEPEPESNLRALELETAAAAMSEEQWQEFVKRTRGGH